MNHIEYDINSHFDAILTYEYFLLRGSQEYYDGLPMDPTIGKTAFWRDPYIINTVIPELIAQSEAEEPQILQIGCSTGRESYSIATTLTLEGHSFKLVALDFNPKRVEFAKKGVYGIASGSSNSLNAIYSKALEDRKRVDRLMIENISSTDNSWDGGVIEFTKDAKKSVIFIRDNFFKIPEVRKFPIITAMNFLEHFNDQEIDIFLHKVSNMLEDNGRFICEGIKLSQHELSRHYGRLTYDNYLQRFGLELDPNYSEYQAIVMKKILD